MSLDIIVSLLSGGTVAAIISYFISKRKEDRDDFAQIVSVLQEENERLRKDNEALHTEIHTLRARVIALEAAVKKS